MNSTKKTTTEESPSTLLDKQIQVKEGASKREKALVRLGVQTTGH